MAIQTPKSYAAYSQEILAALQATGITQTAAGGKARAYADITASKLGEVEARQFNNLSQVLLPYATGDSLDFIGAIYGITRIPESNSTTSSSDGTFTFYVQSGTFGSINSGQNITVPAGILIYSAGTSGAVYSVTFQTVLPASANSQAVSTTSVQTGSGGNAPVNTVNTTNFTNYTQSNFGTLLVTNNYGIVSGRDVEDDTSYRYRIQLALQTVGGSSESDLTVQLLTVPGVQNVVFEELPGTFNVYVYTISSSPSAYVLQLAQTVIDDMVAFPISGTAISPDLVGISLSTTLQLVTSSTDTESLTTIVNNAVTAVSNYINNMAIGGTFVINQVASLILQSDPNILDVGLPNSPIQQIYIWRARSDGTYYSRNLVQDYTLGVGERLVVQNITNPINLAVSS